MAGRNPIVQSVRLLRNEGPGAVLRALRRRIYYRHDSIWFERPLDDSVTIIPPRFDGRLDCDHPEEVIEWIASRNVPGTNDAVEIASMRRRGHLFAGVRDGDRLVGYVKIGWERVYVLDYGVDLDLPPGAFFVLDAYIVPDMRGLGGGPFMASASSLEMKRRGFTRRISHVRVDNVPMLRSGARVGYRELGRVRFVSFMGIKIFRPHPATFFERNSMGEKDRIDNQG